jgi:Pyruvate/2-oxoacid:ferredoxin oxidoreductase gamma subunit
MQDEPTPIELIKAVADFLRNEIVPEIKGGHNAFKLRVGINALDLVTRQLTLAGGSDAAEAERLKQLLGEEGPLFDLNRALSEKIAAGEVDLQTLGLAEHLWQTTMDKLAVDQPNYASYKRELGT